MDQDERLVASLRTLGQAYDADVVARAAQALASLVAVERELNKLPGSR